MNSETVPCFKQLVNCGYCARSMRRKNLKDHTARCHKGCAPKTADGEALKMLMADIQRTKNEEKERKDTERLHLANQKRLEKQRSKDLEKEREILQQRQLQAERKEQEEARKRKKKEIARSERTLSKSTKNTANPCSSAALTMHEVDSSDKNASSTSTFDNNTSSAPLEAVSAVHSQKEVATEVSSLNKRGISGGKKNQDNSATEKNMGLNAASGTASLIAAGCADDDAFNSASIIRQKAGKLQTGPTLEAHVSTFEQSHSILVNPSAQASSAVTVSEVEMREKFQKSKNISDLLTHCQDFQYDQNAGSLRCIVCATSSRSKPIHFEPKSDDSKSLQLAKFRDVKKKILDHLYKTSVHKQNLRDFSNQSVEDLNVVAGTRVIRTIYGKIKHGGGYKSIEETIAERAADQVDFGTINHGRHFASSMTSPIYQAVKNKIQKAIKRNMPATGRPPPFCLIADKMTPARTTLQIVGIIHPSQDNGTLQPICLGVQECKDGTGLGTCEEMVDCLKKYYTTDEIKQSLAGIAVDGAYHHHNIKDHMRSVLDLSAEENELLAINWDAAHLIELSAQKSRGQRGSDKTISVPWIKDTFDTVTSVRSFAGRGKNWKELQDCASLESIHSSNNNQPNHSGTVKPLKKFQSFSGTRFARFSQRVLGNMRENYMATCHYLETKPKEGSGLWNKLTRPEFAMRLCGLDDIYNEIGRASERVQSSRLYGWNTVEILEETTNLLQRMARNLASSELNPQMHRFNSAVEEISRHGTYQGVPMQGSSSCQTPTALASVKDDLVRHLTDFTEDLERRTREQTPKICRLSREAFSYDRVMSRADEKAPLAFSELTKLYSAAGYVAEELSEVDWQREYAGFVNAVQAEKLNLDANGLTERQKMLKMKDEEAIYSKLFTDERITAGFRNLAYIMCRSALQSSCEAVTEGMGSVVKNTLEGRENMTVEKLSQEVFVRLNGPKSNQSCDSVLRQAGDIRFGGRNNWHFVLSPQAKFTASSKVVSRINSEEDKFNFASDTED